MKKVITWCFVKHHNEKFGDAVIMVILIDGPEDAGTGGKRNTYVVFGNGLLGYQFTAKQLRDSLTDLEQKEKEVAASEEPKKLTLVHEDHTLQELWMGLSKEQRKDFMVQFEEHFGKY